MHRIARTKLEIGFTPTATVKDINDLLTSIGAQITAMLKGVNQVIVRIPDPGPLIALDALVAQIQSNPIVRYVLKGNMASTEALPPDVDVVNDPGLLSAIDHHLDVRAHAAWNVISLMGEAPNPPNLVVADFFGDGVPNKHFAVKASSSDFASGKLDSHGYHVLGILAGTFHAGDGIDEQRDLVTGLYPSGRFPTSGQWICRRGMIWRRRARRLSSALPSSEETWSSIRAWDSPAMGLSQTGRVLSLLR